MGQRLDNVDRHRAAVFQNRIDMTELSTPSHYPHRFTPDQALGRDFFARDTVEVARALLGQFLVREWGGEWVVGRISETEAYGGDNDSASHAFRGRTTRNAPMFEAPGHAYVYLIYGLHEMFNIVTEPEGRPGAVLIRALRPVAGVDTMRSLRNGRPDFQLANGPGKLAQAMAISRASLNRHDLCRGQALWLTQNNELADAEIITGPRVGIDYAASADRDAPLRFRLHAPLKAAQSKHGPFR